jgi:hypothetical protein
MKTYFTSVCKIFTIFFMLLVATAIAKAQCVAPAMVWQNPVLVSGTINQIGAVYKFASVTDAVDAYVTVKDINGGAALTSIDDNTYGYSAAWQPVIRTPYVQAISSSYVSFGVQFKDSATGNNHRFPCFQLSFIDVDGDNQHIREFVAATGANKIITSNVSILTLTSLGPNFIQATGTHLNFAGIDTASYPTNISYLYKDTSSIEEVRFGNLTDEVFVPQDRYSCGYFKPFIIQNFTVLNVNYNDFYANAYNNNVTLNLIIKEQANKNYFEVERSLDGRNFKAIGIISEGIIKNNLRNYSFTDLSPELLNKTIAYYRLKQITDDGRIAYTKTLPVKLQTNKGLLVQTYPNPFTENITVNFTGAENGIAEINITDITGKNIISKQINFNKGNNILQLNGLSKFAAGIYVMHVFENGTLTVTQKVIKY